MSIKTGLVAAVLLLLFIAVVGWSFYLTDASKEHVLRNRADHLAEGLRRDKQGLTSKLITLKNQFNKLERDNATQRTALQRLAGKLSNTVRERGELAATLDSMRVEKQRIETRLDDTVQERDVLDQRLTGAQGDRERIQQELSAIVSLRDRLAEDLEDAQVAQRRLQDQVTASGEELRLTAAKVVALSQRVTAADQDVSAKVDELKTAQGRVSKLSAQLDTLNEKVERLEEEVARLRLERQQAMSQLAELRTRLQRELSSKDVKIKQLEEDLTLIQLGGDVLYLSGSIYLTEPGQRALALIAEQIQNIPERTVSVEGHTDTVPVGPLLSDRYPSNWDLSIARAMQAARYLTRQGVDPARVRVVGHGPYRPIASNDTREGRSQNRRIEILLLPSGLKTATVAGNASTD